MNLKRFLIQFLIYTVVGAISLVAYVGPLLFALVLIWGQSWSDSARIVVFGVTLSAYSLVWIYLLPVVISVGQALVRAALIISDFKDWGRRFKPKSRPSGFELLKGWDTAARAGRHDEAIAIVDHAMRLLPGWETRIAGASAYLSAGRCTEAEHIVQDTLQELSMPNASESRRVMLTGLALGLLTEIYIVDGRLAEADTTAQKALEQGAKGGPVYKTLAKLALYHGKADEALSYLDLASKEYLANGKELSPYQLTLQAWALTLKGNHTQATALMTDAFGRVDPKNVSDYAELYTIAGYIARAQNKTSESRSAFEKALELDPHGGEGMLAQRELDIVKAHD